MKGFIPIEIPTKKYIKAYLFAQLGTQPMMTTGHNIGNKFYDLLQHKTNERKSEFSNQRYNAQMKLYVSYHTFRHRGAFLNETNIRNFNLYIEQEIKARMRDLFDFYNDLLPSFEANLPEVRRRLGIDIEHWSDDSMKKDYYRYRKRHHRTLFYNKNVPRNVPSENSENSPF